MPPTVVQTLHSALDRKAGDDLAASWPTCTCPTATVRPCSACLIWRRPQWRRCAPGRALAPT
ncbi:MAG: hypothetical protein KIS63_08725 [Caldilineales bacterium]|nr:hypothetical protein [Caldilineales bacterium]